MSHEVRGPRSLAPALDSHKVKKPKTEPDRFVPETPTVIDWNALTVADLKAELARRDISMPSKAKKAELVAALEAT